jgi:Tol biopolymer transport system component
MEVDAVLYLFAALSWWTVFIPLLLIPIVFLFVFLGCGARTGPRQPSVERITYGSEATRTIRMIRTDTDLATARSGIVDLTERPQESQAPCWSPDGTRVAFAFWSFATDTVPATAGLEILNVGLGGSPGTATHPAPALDPNAFIAHIAWGPTGSIAYEDQQAIWLVATTGGARTPLTPPGTIAHYPTWSADGSEIAFIQVDSSGPALVKIQVEDPSHPISRLTSFGGEAQPNWSKDGLSIVFVRGDSMIIYDVASRAERTILSDAQRPCFSPDGTRIAFVRSGQIFLCAVDGSNVQAWTPGPLDTDPSWTLVQPT